jgi:hypothetical protein
MPARPTVSKEPLRVEIVGTDLPGHACGPSPDGGTYQDIHVGLKRAQETIDLVPGDAQEARWTFEIVVKRGDGSLDFGGPFVSGDREDRHLGLRWGTLGADGTFEVFRGAKLRLVDVDRAVVERALSTGGVLRARLGLTDEHGWPRCARVRPPDIAWDVTVA